jgi:hypothetical protein
VIEPAVALTQQDNCTTWELLGQDTQFPNLFRCGDRQYFRPYPGMLVTSYKGQKHLDKTGLIGIGIIVGVVPLERAHGDMKFECYVLWNFRESEYNFPP